MGNIRIRKGGLSLVSPAGKISIKPEDAYRECGHLNWIVWQAAWRKKLPVIFKESGRLFQYPVFLAACLIFVTEYPLVDAMRNLRLSLLINRDTRCGKNTAIIVAAGPRTILIDGALAPGQHRAVALVAIPHQHVSLWPAGSGEKQCAGNLTDGLFFIRLDMDEHGRAATASTGAARHIGSANA